MKELWKDVRGFEGLFQVSSHGRVRSMSRLVLNKLTGVVHLHKGIVLKQQKNGHGYMCISIQHTRKDKKRRYVHQLVAETFLENPNNFHDINHKNEDKADNRVENHEYCDRKHNVNWGTAIERKRLKMYENTMTRFPNVIQYDKNMNVVAVYGNAGHASRVTGYNQGCICRCCRRERTFYKGFIWRYANE